MGYEVIDVLDNRKIGDEKYPVSLDFNINANEQGLLFFSFKLGEFTGVDALNPVKVKVEHSFTAGESWQVAPGEANLEIAAEDYFTWKKDVSNSEMIGPRVRLTFYLDNPGRFSVIDVKKSFVDESSPVFNSVSITSGGITAETSFTRNGLTSGVVQDDAVPTNNRPLPTSLMDSVTGTPVDMSSGSIPVYTEFPNGADAATLEYPDAVTEVIKYREGGVAGTVVKTVTLVFTDSSKNTLLSIEES